MASGSGELSIQDLDSSVIQVATSLSNLGAERSSFTPQQRDKYRTKNKDGYVSYSSTGWGPTCSDNIILLLMQ